MSQPTHERVSSISWAKKNIPGVDWISDRAHYFVRFTVIAVLPGLSLLPILIDTVAISVNPTYVHYMTTLLMTLTLLSFISTDKESLD